MQKIFSVTKEAFDLLVGQKQIDTYAKVEDNLQHLKYKDQRFEVVKPERDNSWIAKRITDITDVKVMKTVSTFYEVSGDPILSTITKFDEYHGKYTEVVWVYHTQIVAD